MSEMTKLQRRAAKRAAKAVAWFDEAMDELCNDPMTHGVGAPVGEIATEWKRRHRRQLRECLSDPNNTSVVRQMLETALKTSQ